MNHGAMTDGSWRYAHRFLETIAPWAEAYVHSGFSYLVARTGSTWTLSHGRLYLRSEPLGVSHQPVVTGAMAVGYMNLPAATDGFRSLIEDLCNTGSIDTQIGRVTLQLDQGQPVSAFFNPFDSAGLASQNRLPVLTLRGASRGNLFAQPESDWAVRAEGQPFDSVAELANSYFLGGYQGDSAAIEIVAQPVAVVGAQSTLSGDKAQLTIVLASRLDTSKARLGYRVLSKGEVVARGSAKGDELAWEEMEGAIIGKTMLNVPPAAVLQCFASYAGVSQHFYWVADPRSFQNPRRMASETYDPHLEVTRDNLLGAGKPRKDSREFEAGVATLSWMLGFSPWHIGTGRRLSDAPDLLLASSGGDMLVVECTIGLLKTDNKVARLAERARALQQSLAVNGNSHVRVLPVMVTALERAAVEAELDAARLARVLVITREGLQDLLQRTVLIPDSKAVFDEAWASLEESQKQNSLKLET